ncbi:MAG TPA: alpha/beta hydrolase [Pyrinomonadaceae bacterium]|nr:alpha/beta hydrolase [Pyrinomonadaceae bacterium]
MPLKKLTVGGVEWEYTTGGRGEQTILLFHGAVGGAETMQWLAERFGDEYRTIAPTVADVRRLAEVCDAASAILDREHVGRAVVFGGSFGALVAQAFLKRRRRQVEHLVLLSAGAPNRKVGARSERLLKLLRPLPFALLRALMKAELSKYLNAPAPPEHAERLAEFRRRLDEYFDRRLTKQTLLSRVALAADFNLRETYDAADYEDWPGRVLIIDSDDDPMVSAEDRRRLHALFPRALLCTFEGAGHMIPLLKTEELVGLVKAFLREDYKPPWAAEHCPVA